MADHAEVTELPTEELVGRCRAGDRAAFGQLVERFQAAVYGLAYYHVGRRDEALDIAQQAFLAAYVHLHELAEPARFGGWLARIVTNQCLHWRRRHRPALALDAPPVQALLAPEAEAPEAAAERGELRREVRRALMAVPPPQRLALTLYYVAGLRYRQIADVVALPVTTVKGRIQDGQRRLRRALEPVYPGYGPALVEQRRGAGRLRTATRLKEKVMEQLEDLQVRQTSAGDRDGVVLFTSRRGGRHVAVRLDARHAAIGNPRAVEPEPPGRGVRIVTGADVAPPDGAAGPTLADDYRFFADLLAGAGVEVAAVVLDVASGAEPQATVHVRRGTAEAAVPAAVGQALALAAAANAPIRATPAAVAAGGLAEGGRPPPEPADVARAVEAAGATYRLGQALAAAARGRAGSFAVRLVPAEGRLAGQVGVVAPEGHVVDTIPGLALGFAHVGDATAPVSAGRIEISGVGSFAVTVRPGAAETLLELAPLPAADR